MSRDAASTDSGRPLLSVRDLVVDFETPRATVRATHGVSFDVFPGETLGVIGASGCGKSTTALALLGLLPRPAGRIRSGEAQWAGRDLLSLSEAEHRRVRGNKIAMIFQDPLSALHPALPVVNQVAEAIRAHETSVSVASAREQAREALAAVGIPPAALENQRYTHHWSGGMRQRAMIAMALVHRPQLLIADEPTTALDVTIQAQILDLLRLRIGSERCSTILITHDLGVIAELADRVAVMEAGRIVESGPVERVFGSPEHSYTAQLLARRSVAQKAGGSGLSASTAQGVRDGNEPVLEVHSLDVTYLPRGRRRIGVRALEDVSFTLGRGETLGIVGETGCGKSTLARTLVGLEQPVGGRIVLKGEEANLTRPRPARMRRAIQIVFQDAQASLNPRRSVGYAVAQGLRLHSLLERDRQGRVHELLELVGLSAGHASRYPHELSGGQQQRVAMARALAVEPEILVLDEPVTALDLTTRERILQLLERLQTELGLSLILISHDLSVVRDLADRVAVMYLGRVVEVANVETLFASPTHPYTKALLSANPVADPSRRVLGRRIVLDGEVPHGADPPAGCRFHTRCWKTRARCREVEPSLEPRAHGQESACFYPENLPTQEAV